MHCTLIWVRIEILLRCRLKKSGIKRFSYRKVVSLFVQLISYHLLSFMRFRFIEQKFVCCATHSNILSHWIAYTSKVSVKHTNQQQHTTRTVNSDDWCADSCLLTRLPAVSILFLVVSLRYLQISHTVASIASKKVILLPVVWNEHKKIWGNQKLKRAETPHRLITYTCSLFSLIMRFLVAPCDSSFHILMNLALWVLFSFDAI